MIDEHVRSFDDLYRGLGDLNLGGVRFPLVDIEAFRWNRGEWNDPYYNYHYRRFTCHILSRLAPANGHDVLVVGCGFGLDEKNIKSLFHDTSIWSVDVSRHMLQLAIAGESPSRFSLALAEKLPFPDRCFDRVVSREVIEHVINPDIMIREISRVLKPGGVAVITTEHEESLGPTNYWDSNIGKKLATLFNLPQAEPQYKDDAPSVHEVRDMVASAGLELVEVFFDGALYKYLHEISPLLRARMARAAHYFSRLENNRVLAPLLCDQVKYVLRKPTASSREESPVHYACVRCGGRLLQSASDWACPACGTAFPVANGIPDFIQHPASNGQQDRLTAAVAPRRLHRAVILRCLHLLRQCYCWSYLLAATIAAAFAKSNRLFGSRLLPADDPYRRFLKAP